MWKLLNQLQSILNFEGYQNPQFQRNGIGKIGTATFVLGIFLGFNVCLALITYISTFFFASRICFILCIWSIYLSLLMNFHFMEFFITAVKQPKSVSYDSLIINHSKAYTLAAIASALEYWIESILLYEYKFKSIVICVGLFLLSMGQITRSVAMWHCGENFSHLIKEEKPDSHKLVTTGLYNYLRHPSYFGFFYWSIGTQVLLCNPICFILYTYSSWKFFADRVPYEEALLIKFYKDEYINYRKRTWIGIPFITNKIHNE